MKGFLKQNISGMLLLVIVVTVIIIIANYANWTMSESTYLYIFSTIAQSFAALIGLLATFLIFMITNIDNKRSDIGRIIVDLYTKYKPGRYPSPLKLGDYYMEKDIRVADNIKSNISVYPNPFTGKIHFDNISNDISMIIITDLCGKTLLKANYKGEKNMDVTHWNSGIYLLTFVKNNGEKQITKIVKE